MIRLTPGRAVAIGVAGTVFGNWVAFNVARPEPSGLPTYILTRNTVLAAVSVAVAIYFVFRGSLRTAVVAAIVGFSQIVSVFAGIYLELGTRRNWSEQLNHVRAM